MTITLKCNATLHGADRGVDKIVIHDDLTISGEGPIPAKIEASELERRVNSALIEYLTKKGNDEKQNHETN